MSTLSASHTDLTMVTGGGRDPQRRTCLLPPRVSFSICSSISSEMPRLAPHGRLGPVLRCCATHGSFQERFGISPFRLSHLPLLSCRAHEDMGPTDKLLPHQDQTGLSFGVVFGARRQTWDLKTISKQRGQSFREHI